MDFVQKPFCFYGSHLGLPFSSTLNIFSSFFTATRVYGQVGIYLSLDFTADLAYRNRFAVYLTCTFIETVFDLYIVNPIFVFDKIDSTVYPASYE